MPLVPFLNDAPAAPIASYWTGCEVVTGRDGVVRVAGPHGCAEYPPGTELRDVNIPAHWPLPVEPAEWEEDVTANTEATWRKQADDMEEVREASEAALEAERARLAAVLEIRDTHVNDLTVSEWQALAEAAGLDYPDKTKAAAVADLKNQARA